MKKTTHTSTMIGFIYIMSQPYGQIDDLDQRMLDKIVDEIKRRFK